MMTTIPPDIQATLETLERKRRLGHYAIIWHDGKPVAIGEDAPPNIHE